MIGLLLVLVPSAIITNIALVVMWITQGWKHIIAPVLLIAYALTAVYFLTT